DVEFHGGEKPAGGTADLAAAQNPDARNPLAPGLQFLPFAATLLCGVVLEAPLEMENRVHHPLHDLVRHPIVDDASERQTPGVVGLAEDAVHPRPGREHRLQVRKSGKHARFGPERQEIFDLGRVAEVRPNTEVDVGQAFADLLTPQIGVVDAGLEKDSHGRNAPMNRTGPEGEANVWPPLPGVNEARRPACYRGSLASPRTMA